MKIVNLFDAYLQKEVPHNVTLDGNGEFVFTSQETGHTVKFKADTKEELEKLMLAHKEANEGQITIESLEKKMAEFFPDALPTNDL